MVNYDLVCFCGAMLIPVDGFWVCPHKGSTSVAMEPSKVHYGPQVPDRRVGLCPRPLPPRVGPPGPPGSKLKVVRRTRVHAGPQAACLVCSPETAGAVIAQLERLRKRQEGRSTR